VIGAFSITGFVQYLSGVQVWEPRIVIARIDGAAQEFFVTCGAQCYRKNRQEALMADWAAGRLPASGAMAGSFPGMPERQRAQSPSAIRPGSGPAERPALAAGRFLASHRPCGRSCLRSDLGVTYRRGFERGM
jgi:hypothetical protein